MESLPQRLKRLRLEAGLTHKEVAAKIGVSTSTYRDWEYGRRIQGEPYLQLANVFKVTIFELLTGEKRNDSELFKLLIEIEQMARRAQKLAEPLL